MIGAEELRIGHHPAETKLNADDLYRTHALLNVLWSSYQGMTTLLTLLAEAEGATGTSPTMAQCHRAVENLTGWRERWEAGDFWLAGPQASDGDVQLAEAMLNTHRGHLVWSLREVSSKSSRENLLRDRSALAFRLATACQEALSRDLFVQGLVAYGARVRAPEVVQRWQPHVGANRDLVARSQKLWEWFMRHDEVPSAFVSQLLDETLLLPLAFSHRILDLDFLRLEPTGAFGFKEAGIRDESSSMWTARGFSPYSAGQWYLAGIGPDEASRWVEAGVSDPYAASHFHWRGMSLDTARPWIRMGFGGRSAVAWHQASIPVAEAARWRQSGIHYPQQIPRGR